MSKISCSVTNCSHNCKDTCYANIINIAGKNAKEDCDTCCGSFLDSANYSDLTNNVNDQGNPCNAITCNVSTCSYNSNSLCTADSIQVNGSNVKLYSETNCTTFKTT